MTFVSEDPLKQPNKIDPFVDVLFKHLFGNPRNKEIVLAFVNAILGRKDKDKIVDYKYLNVELAPEYNFEKIPRLDLLLETNSNEQINLELQAQNYAYYPSRIMYYASNLYTKEVMKGKTYLDLKKIICINIVRELKNPDNEVIAPYCFKHFYKDVRLSDLLK